MKILRVLFPFALLLSSVASAEPKADALVVFPGGFYVTPEGERVATGGSKTGGLQEAVDRAARDNWDLRVAGGDFKHQVYFCTAPLVFPPLQGKSIDIGAATLNFDGFEDPTQPALRFDSCMNLSFACRGQIVYHQRGTAVKFEPRNNLPVDDFVGPCIVASTFSFMGIAYVSTPVAFVGRGTGIAKEEVAAACVTFATDYSITRCKFEFVELLGGISGIRVNTPGERGSFAHNRIEALFIHEQFNTSIFEGTQDSPRNAALNTNQWEVHCAPAAGACGINTYGSNGYWVASVVAESGALSAGLLTHASSTENRFILTSFDGEVKGDFTREAPGSNRFP